MMDLFSFKTGKVIEKEIATTIDINTLKNTDEDIEEIPDVDFINSDDIQGTNGTSTPQPPTTVELCTRWFIALCEDCTIIKRVDKNYNCYVIGTTDVEKFENPYLWNYGNRYMIIYKDFRNDIDMVEGERIIKIFNASIDIYYNTLFTNKLAEIEKSKTPRQMRYGRRMYT